MLHSFYIRMRYQDHAQFLQRLALMKATLIPSLAWQKGQFSVQVLVSCPEHGVLVDNAFEYPVAVRSFVYEGVDIMSRLDSDDIVFPGYVERVQSFFEVGVPKVVTFQIKKFEWFTGDTFEYSGRYNDRRCSMFTTVINPPQGVHVFTYKHGDLWQVAPDGVVVCEDDLCRLVVHGSNTLTRVTSKDRNVKDIEGGVG